VLGGTSPIDHSFIALLDGKGALDAVDPVEVHGFPPDWDHWQVHIAERARASSASTPPRTGRRKIEGHVRDALHPAKEETHVPSARDRRRRLHWIAPV
jgi:hypothetical protein